MFSHYPEAGGDRRSLSSGDSAMGPLIVRTSRLGARGIVATFRTSWAHPGSRRKASPTPWNRFRSLKIPRPRPCLDDYLEPSVPESASIEKSGSRPWMVTRMHLLALWRMRCRQIATGLLLAARRASTMLRMYQSLRSKEIA